MCPQAPPKGAKIPKRRQQQCAPMPMFYGVRNLISERKSSHSCFCPDSLFKESRVMQHLQRCPLRDQEVHQGGTCEGIRPLPDGWREQDAGPPCAHPIRFVLSPASRPCLFFVSLMTEIALRRSEPGKPRSHFTAMASLKASVDTHC